MIPGPLSVCLKPLPVRGFLFLLCHSVPEMALSVENDTVCRFLHSGEGATLDDYRHPGEGNWQSATVEPGLSQGAHDETGSERNTDV